MPPSRPNHGFTHVDAQPDPAAWVRVLETLHQEPFYRTYKARIIELLAPKPGERFLEIGCGTGRDARALAQQFSVSVVATDFAHTMAQHATNAGLYRVAVCDASAIPFGSDAFDAVWADRTLQHVLDPEAAVYEMARVVKLDGRVLVVDPDYSTQAMSFPDSDLAKRVLAYRAEHGLRNGTLAHRMPEVFQGCGLSSVSVETARLRVTDPTAVDNVMGLRTWARSASELGHMAEEDAMRWEQLFDETVGDGTFEWSVDFFITIGYCS
jgi:SAM-dependent methyltransferase